MIILTLNTCVLCSLLYNVNYSEMTRTTHPNAAFYFLHLDTRPVEMKRSLAEIDEYRTIGIDAHGGEQSGFHDVQVDDVEFVSQEFSIPREEYSPRHVVEAATHHVSGTVGRTFLSSGGRTRAVEDAAVVRVISVG